MSTSSRAEGVLDSASLDSAGLDALELDGWIGFEPGKVLARIRPPSISSFPSLRMLVYNHHHELIAASDTISAVGLLSQAVYRTCHCCLVLIFIYLQMKTRAESIDTDLEKLRMAFSEISRLNEELTLESEGNENNARRDDAGDLR